MIFVPDDSDDINQWKWIRNHFIEKWDPDIFQTVKSSLAHSNREIYLYNTTVGYWNSLFPKDFYRNWLHSRVESALKSCDYKPGVYQLSTISTSSPLHNLEKLLSIAETLNKEFYNPFSLTHIGKGIVTLHPGSYRSMLFGYANNDTKMKLAITDFARNEFFLKTLNKTLSTKKFSQTSDTYLKEFYQLDRSKCVKLRIDTLYGYQLIDCYIPQVSNKRSTVEILEKEIRIDDYPLIVRGVKNHLAEEVIKLIS